MISQLGNHLWHSTVFTCAVALLALILRRNRAALRHALWLTASIKFLIPFSLLIGIGREVGWRSVPPIQQPQLEIVQQMSEPFASQASPTPIASVPGPTNPVPAILFSIWLCGFTAHSWAWWRRWRRVQVALRAASPSSLNLPTRAMFGPAHLEPGVFGILKPVLLLPRGITERLTPVQFDAIIAHELCHVRRRDNLAAAIHMVVEALFWFHPLVWWIERRLVEERERACDEEVLRMAIDPQDYAEGIVNVCRLYLEAPLVCISGVTGANLKRRVEAIMTNRSASKLNLGRKLLLAAAGITAVAGPLTLGMLSASRIHAQPATATPAPKFEVASVKPSAPGLRPGATFILPGGERYTGSDVPLWFLIQDAWRLHRDQITGGPNWFASDRFDVNAKAEKPSSLEEMRLMLQTLLADRFKLSFHFETVQGPVYALVLDKGGPKLTRHDAEFASEPFRWKDQTPAQQLHIAWHATSAPMSYLAWQLASVINVPVINSTGLEGEYDFDLAFTMALPLAVPEGALINGVPVDTMGETVFEAIRKLGLRLERQQGPVQFMRIDHVERPSAN